MTRALVTQMQSALEGVLKAHRIQESRTPPTTFSEANAKVDAIKYAVGDAEKAITAACEYLATEQSQSVEPFAYFNLGTEYHTRGKIAFHKEPTRNLETRWWGPDTPLYTRSVPQQVAVPEGYVLVPIEPTEKMIVDLMCTGLRHAEYKPGCDPTIAHMAQGYTAMIAAAAQGEKP